MTKKESKSPAVVCGEACSYLYWRGSCHEGEPEFTSPTELLLDWIAFRLISEHHAFFLLLYFEFDNPVVFCSVEFVVPL